MRLSTFTDYSLRVLIYLALQSERLATIAEIASAYQISENHLMKVVHHLGRGGYIETLRGKGGGMRLGRSATEINLGQIIRQSETDLNLVECHSSDSLCRIQSACQLKTILDEALQAMFLVLDGYTLADVAANRDALLSSLVSPPLPAAVTD